MKPLVAKKVSGIPLYYPHQFRWWTARQLEIARKNLLAKLNAEGKTRLARAYEKMPLKAFAREMGVNIIKRRR